MSDQPPKPPDPFVRQNAYFDRGWIGVLSSVELRVLFYYHTKAVFKLGGTCDAKLPDIAKAIGHSDRRHVREARRVLVKLGLLRIIDQGGGSESSDDGGAASVVAVPVPDHDAPPASEVDALRGGKKIKSPPARTESALGARTESALGARTESALGARTESAPVLDINKEDKEYSKAQPPPAGEIEGAGALFLQPIAEPIDTAPPEPTPEQIYQAFPLKAGKPSALRAIAAAIKRLKQRGPPPPDCPSWADWLLKRVQAYAGARKGEDPKFTKYPQGWMNDERYDQETTAGGRYEKPSAEALGEYRSNIPMRVIKLGG